MSKNYLKYLLLLFVAFTISCSISRKAEKSKNLSVQFGTNKGGIVENTDMSVIDDFPNNTEIDAYSGATSRSLNFGIHSYLPLRKNELEFGVDFINHKQKFSYNDDFNNWYGERDFTINQFSLPLTYNLKILPNKWEKLDLQLKFGLLGQFNFVNVNSTGNLADYSINPASGGFTFGISFYPIVFKNNSKLGLFFDGYRGSQIYVDYYNKKDFEMPGTAYIKYGLKYKF